MKRLNLGVLVSAYVCFSLAPAISGASSATISFPLPNSIRAGEKVTAPLKVDVTNGHLGGLLLDIMYDPAAVTILSDGDIAGAGATYMCMANAHYATSNLSTSRMACVTGYIGNTGAITLANVTITGVGKKQGTTSIKIVPRSFVSSIDPMSTLPQPASFSPLPSAISKKIYVRH